MVNKTVYPYGTGGQLPSSVGIVNDLVTGGADKALSAQQGVVINQKFYEQEHYVEKIDVSGLGSLASNIHINATSGQWASSSNYSMFFINVKPGGVYRITGSANGTARYALLKTNSYASGETPDYATGETLKWLAKDSVLTLEMPSDANWLCISKLENRVDVVPSEMAHIVSMEEHEAEKNSGYHREIYYGSHAFGVDAVVGSSTFGKLISAGSDKNWGVSRFYDVSGYNVVSFYANTGSTSNIIANHSGAVFYDKDYNPLPNNAWTISKTSSAETGVISLNIPDGAKYFRFTAYHSASLDAQRSVILSRQSAKFGAIYYGEKISLESENRYSVTRIKGSSLTMSTVVQSCALYGDYLFFVNEYIKEIICYNLKTGRDIYKLTTGWTSATWNSHANQSCFGTEKYDPADMFPILYVSDARPTSGRCAIRALRIIPTLTDGEITSFTVTLIQTIYLPVMTTENGLGYANMVIDPDNNTMWTYSRNTNSGESTSGQATFTQFNIPALTLSEVTLEDSDRLTWFRETWALYNNQGATIKGGKMYMTRGMQSDSEVNVIDLYWSRKRVSRIDLDKDGYGIEPEGCFLYNNTICYSGRSPSLLYQLNII